MPDAAWTEKCKTSAAEAYSAHEPWTHEEDNAIMDQPDKTDDVIAQELGRSVRAVWARRYVLEERKNPKKRRKPITNIPCRECAAGFVPVGGLLLCEDCAC